MGTCFMEKSYVVAAILHTKNKKKRENHVTIEEVNGVANVLQKEYNKKDLNVCITDVIDEEYFKSQENIIVINKEKGLSLDSIRQRYQGYISYKILTVLWNEAFITEAICKM